MEYLQISRTRLTAIADQARRLGGVENSLSPAQIETVLSNLSLSGGSGGSTRVVEVTAECSATVNVREEK